MVKLITLIPTNYNDGSKVEAEKFQELEKEFLKLAGGYSIEGIVEGGWVDEAGKVYRDKSRKYSVVIPEDNLEKLKELIIDTGKKLKQKSMYFEVNTTEIDFLEIE